MKNGAQSDPAIVDGLIDDIYAAAEDVTAWGRVLKTIDAVTDGSCSALLSMKILRGKVRGYNMASDGYVKRFIEYQDEYIFRDNVAGIVKGMDGGKIISSAELFGRDGAKRSTVYKEFYEKFGFAHFLGMNLLSSTDYWISLVTFRGPHLFPHNAIDRQLFERIGPHILRSMKVSQIVSSHRAEADAALDTIEKLHHATFLLDGNRRVTSMNAVARTLIDRGEVKISSGGILEVGAKRIDGREGRQSAAGRSADMPDIHATSLHGSRRPAGTMIFNLEDRSPNIFPSLAQETGELVVVFDAGAKLAAIVDEAKRKFGLTSAEARVYEAAMLHSTSHEIAHSLGLSRETVRSHMKHIFLKMDISSHVELLQYSALRSRADGHVAAC